jgi:hypothetical protein
MYGSEAWTICKREESRVTVAKMKFTMRIEGNTLINHRRNTDITKAPNTESIMNFTVTYRANWKHILWMHHSRIPFQMLHCQPKEKRSIGRPFKR